MPMPHLNLLVSCRTETSLDFLRMLTQVCRLVIVGLLLTAEEAGSGPTSAQSFLILSAIATICSFIFSLSAVKGLLKRMIAASWRQRRRVLDPHSHHTKGTITCSSHKAACDGQHNEGDVHAALDVDAAMQGLADADDVRVQGQYDLQASQLCIANQSVSRMAMGEQASVCAQNC